MLTITITGAVAVGVCLGLLGGGGSILAVPPAGLRRPARTRTSNHHLPVRCRHDKRHRGLTPRPSGTRVLAHRADLRGRNTTRVRAGLLLPRMLGYGAAIGFITGLVGAGGGSLLVPALTLLGNLAMSSAVGTSLVVIALNSGAGLAGHLSTVTLAARGVRV